MDIKLQVESIINKRWEGLKDPKELISLYGIEKQTNQGYNGRQLLELFQNCEDEGASKVRILLDSSNSLLEISNDGIKPFSIKGYDSIFYPGLSSKVSSGFIGNKGLGFRSIINWADEISIISNNFKVVFNPEFKKDILLNIIGYTEEELNEIRRERKINAAIYPIALLNSCKIEDLDEPHHFTTTISIKYKKELEKDIISQLESISSKTLLFLQNINTIEIDGDVIKETISITRIKLDDSNSEIKYKGATYYVLTDEGIVDEDLIEDKESSEPKRYSVKIAYNEDLTFRDKFLYNYFKTQIPFELPFVVHASLELDQNRNHSTESKLNPFILDKLFNLHIQLIEILKSKINKSWLPFQSINTDKCLIYIPYLDLINSNWGNYEVYPTLSGEYLNIGNAMNLGNDFAKFMEDNDLGKYFEEQITFCDLEVLPKFNVGRPDNYPDILEYIGSGLNLRQRVKFIKLVVRNYPNEKFALLIDESNELIKKDDYVYTDKTADNKELKVPNYSNIRFINSDLHKLLIIEFNLQSEIQKSRMLKEILEKISNVYSFEPQTVTNAIISEASNMLNNNPTNKADIIKEFYQVLFHNFKLREDVAKLDYEVKVPCLNRYNNVQDIKNIVFSEQFSTGQLAFSILGKIYDDKFTLADIKLFGLEEKNSEEVEHFFKWLGINHFVIIDKLKNGARKEYTDFINTSHKIQITSYEIYSLKYFEDIFAKNKITVNNFIAWLSFDEQLKDIFSNYTVTNSREEKINYSFRGAKTINPFINYLYHSITKYFKFDNYLITNKKEEWFNPFKIDYEYLQGVNKELDRKEVDRIILFFGAKKDFNNLDIEFLKTRTCELAARKNHKGAQVFYKNLVGHYKENKKQIIDVPLFAKEGDAVVVKSSTEIYYSDRIQLPDLLTKKFPLLYYPSRAGGATAIEMFGLKNLNNLNLNINKIEINNEINSDFQMFIKEVKPFILAFRLDKITSEDVKKAQVQRLNKLKINCCNQLSCRIEEEEFEVESYNYIFYDDQFYINVPLASTLDDLKQNKQFVDNLSDIFLKLFDTIDEKKIFESIIKQCKEDNVYDINNELAEGILEEAKILLGEISIRLSIWKSIFKLKQIEEISDLNDNNLEFYIDRFFPEVRLQELFISDDNVLEIYKIRQVFAKLKISLQEFNLISDYKVSFDNLFKSELIKYYESHKKNLKNQIWYYLNFIKSAEQRNFLQFIHKIEILFISFSLDKNFDDYDFDQLILEQLNGKFSAITFALNNNSFTDYDLLEKENLKSFSDEDILIIRKDEELNSLSYFDNQVTNIKSILKKHNAVTFSQATDGFMLNKSLPSELIVNFQIEVVPNPYLGSGSDAPWLGGPSEPSAEQKKKLGTNVEEVVKMFLDENPSTYTKVEHISKTNEGAHYDIKYFDTISNQIKYIECKYYNGFSFFLSREEKIFADSYPEQYEIWLVNKDSKIYCIKSIKELGDLQPVNYKVNVKISEYAIAN